MVSSVSDDGNVVRPNRYERRRMETRSRLIKAGREVVSEKGFNASTIQDITEAADVGRGSFYNFFDTKDELVEIIISDHVNLLLRMQSACVNRFADPAIALAAVVRYGFEIELNNPSVARFTVQTQSIGGPFYQKFHDATFELIERGRGTGVFVVSSSEVSVVAIASLMLGTIQAILIGRLPSDCTDNVVEGILRLLGVPRGRIRAILSTDLPSLEDICRD